MTDSTKSEGDEDTFDFTFPANPSALRKLPDDELARIARKDAFRGLQSKSDKVQLEMNIRLIAALKSFKAAADRSSRTLNVLTAVLVVLTIVLVVYTIRTG